MRMKNTYFASLGALLVSLALVNCGDDTCETCAEPTKCSPEGGSLATCPDAAACPGQPDGAAPNKDAGVPDVEAGPTSDASDSSTNSDVVQPPNYDLETVAEVGSKAEWDLPKEVLMHTPGDELFLGVVHPDAALFERPFSVEKAAQEHQRYIGHLRSEGAKVHTVVQTLLAGTLDKSETPIPGKHLDDLRAFAKQFIKVDASTLPAAEQTKQQQYLDDVVMKLQPKELVKVILEQPTVHLTTTGINTGYAATYELAPVMNLYFLRDQMITTSKGVVISKMNSVQREVETKIIKFVLNKLGVTPIYEVMGDARLEGGDFLPAGDTAFLGQGLRTHADAVASLLENKVFGTQRVVIVKEPWLNQNQMHLDTYFNIIDSNLAVLVKDRMTVNGTPPDPQKLLKVDVYELEGAEYKRKVTDGDFQDYVTNTLKFKLLPVTDDDQLKYGINFLTVASKKIYAVDGVSDAYKQSLKDNGVNATWLDFSNMTGGYGAAHCVTQILNRKPK